MKITVTKQEAERALETHFFHKLEEAPLSVHIEDMEPIREVHAVTYTSMMVQDLWTRCAPATDTSEQYAAKKVTLIKLYRDLHCNLTGYQISLLEAKNFVESHKRH
jgi:ribosomal protein L7/L12